MLELSNYTEIMTGSLIIGCSILFLALALRHRSPRSLQLQFSIAFLIWAATEVPRVIETVGVANFSAYDELGLQFHFLSMFVIAAFIVVRSRALFGLVKFNDKVGRAVSEAMGAVLGPGGLAAAAFYFDISQAKTDPEAFVGAARKLFGAGSAIIEKSIAEQLSPELAGKKDLADIIRMARASAI